MFTYSFKKRPFSKSTPTHIFAPRGGFGKTLAWLIVGSKLM